LKNVSNPPENAIKDLLVAFTVLIFDDRMKTQPNWESVQKMLSLRPKDFMIILKEAANFQNLSPPTKQYLHE
jgi:hypothetical protein